MSKKGIGKRLKGGAIQDTPDEVRYASARDRDINEDMTKYGFAKALQYRHLTINEDKTITCTVIAYYAEEIGCGGCGTHVYTWLNSGKTGVLKSCLYCGSTTGPLSKSFGTQVKEYKISLGEALAIIKSRGATKREVSSFIRKIKGKPFGRPMARRPLPKKIG